MHDEKQEVEVSAITPSSSQMRRRDLTPSVSPLSLSLSFMFSHLPTIPPSFSSPPTGGAQIDVNQTCFTMQQLPAGPSPMRRFSSSCPVTHKSRGGKWNAARQDLKIVNSLQILSQTQTNPMVYAHEIRFCTTVLSEEIFSPILLDIKQRSSALQSLILLDVLFCCLAA